MTISTRDQLRKSLRGALESGANYWCAAALAEFVLLRTGSEGAAIATAEAIIAYMRMVAEERRPTVAKAPHPAADLEGTLRASVEVHAVGAAMGLKTIVKGR